MAHSLETRVPFLDNDLVDFAQRVPVRLKLRDLEHVVELDENEPGPKTERYFEQHARRQAAAATGDAAATCPSRSPTRSSRASRARTRAGSAATASTTSATSLLNDDAAMYEFLDPTVVRAARRRPPRRAARTAGCCSGRCSRFEHWCRTFLNGAAPVMRVLVTGATGLPRPPSGRAPRASATRSSRSRAARRRPTCRRWPSGSSWTSRSRSTVARLPRARRRGHPPRAVARATATSRTAPRTCSRSTSHSTFAAARVGARRRRAGVRARLDGRRVRVRRRAGPRGRPDAASPTFYFRSKYAAEVPARRATPSCCGPCAAAASSSTGRASAGCSSASSRERSRRGEEIVVDGDPGLRINPIHVDDAARVFEPALSGTATGAINVAGDRRGVDHRARCDARRGDRRRAGGAPPRGDVPPATSSPDASGCARAGRHAADRARRGPAGRRRRRQLASRVHYTPTGADGTSS